MVPNIPQLIFFRFKDNLQLLTYAISLIIILSMVLIFFIPSYEGRSTFIILMAIGSLFLAVLSIRSTLQKHPSSILISLIGFKKSGKTVFLTMLFNQFTSKKIDGILFSTYGSETAEEVRKNLNLLDSKKWLPHTPISFVFPFRAIATLESGLNRKNFKVEIDDYAGEFSEELSDEGKVHQSAYIDYVIKSDIIFIAIDGDTILKSIDSKDHSRTHYIENFYITALKLIREGKGVPLERKMQTPVALIITKCDLFYPFFEKIDNSTLTGKSVSKWGPEHKIFLTQSIQRLTEFCESKCSNYEIFFVTAVGKLGEGSLPPTALNPENITPPLVWALHNAE